MLDGLDLLLVEMGIKVIDEHMFGSVRHLKSTRKNLATSTLEMNASAPRPSHPLHSSTQCREEQLMDGGYFLPRQPAPEVNWVLTR